MQRKELFNEFSKTSAKAWKQRLQYKLKGADYNQTLVYDTLEGIQIKPFYHGDDIGPYRLAQRHIPDTWAIGQHIFVTDAKTANAKALESLQSGVETLMFTLPSEKIAVKTLLKGIDLASTRIHFYPQFLSKPFVAQLLNATEGTTSQIHLNCDIVGHLARSGNWFKDRSTDFAELTEILALPEGKSIEIVGVDASGYQNAGAHSVQQLAYALAHAHEYLHHFAPKLISGLTFTMAIGGNYFFEIAKLRALRRLWGTLADSYDIAAKCHIIAIPTKRNKTLYDYNTNLLRTITECMSGILGGADTVCNIAYDGIYHKDNKFAERLARNQLLILKHEGHFDQVAHAADGTYYIEALTHQLAEKALALFKDIEAAGGFLHHLKNGTIQRKIAESAEKEQDLFDKNKKVLVGTNAYQNPEDTMKDELELYPFVKRNPRKTLIAPIIPRRLAETMERERLKSEQ